MGDEMLGGQDRGSETSEDHCISPCVIELELELAEYRAVDSMRNNHIWDRFVKVDLIKFANGFDVGCKERGR